MSETTEELPPRSIDKSIWSDGPWKTEPDRLQWQYAGYACLIVRHPDGGHLCGYVGIDNQHPYYGKHYDQCEDLEVHGGLTHANACCGYVCHVPEPGMPDDVWWLGFDCAHAFDLSPGYEAAIIAVEQLIPALSEFGEQRARLRSLRPEFMREVYRTLPYVQRETERLAEQLAALKA